MLIASVIAACEAELETIGTSLFCIASDGESRRGSALTALTQKRRLDRDGELYALVGGMHLMNLLVGDNDLTVDKDPKHIMKRCRNFMLRKSGFVVYGTHITSALLRYHLKESGVSSIRVNNLLDPTDRQNVPVCYTLLKEIWSLKDPKPTDKPTFVAARKALQMVGTLFRHLVLPFVQITLDLHEQLKHLSAAAHLATFLFTVHDAQSRAMPSLTYKDIILMVKNTFFSVAKAKIQEPKGSFWLILLGTDRLESTFGVVRSMVGNDANADMSSLTTRLSHAVECLNIFSEHPEWDRGPRRLKLPAIEDGNGDVMSKTDHISPSNWKGNVSLDRVIPLTVWNDGRQLVETEFTVLNIASHFAEIEKKELDMLYPFGTLDTLDNEEAEEDDPTVVPDQSRELSLCHVNLDSVNLEEDNEPLSLADHVDIEETRDGRGKHNPFVDVGNGKMVSKARVLRELERSTFSKVPGSTDRLTRVAGGTRFAQKTGIVEANTVFGSSTFCVGDPAATIIICEGLTFLAIIHINDIIVDFNSCIELDVKLLMEPTVTVQFQICQLVELGGRDQDPIQGGSEWRWNRTMESKVLKTRGAFIQVVNPTIITERIGEPVYSFQSTDLRALGASLLSSISLQDRSLLPSLRKRTKGFPYRSSGKYRLTSQFSND